jgi:hypothetical protein
MKNQKLQIMKKQILLIGLLISFLPLTLLGQKKYYNLDFEKSDTTGCKIFKLKNEYDGTVISIDSTKSVSGTNSLYINTVHADKFLGGLITFILPKQYNKGLRTIDISVSIFAQDNAPNLECVVTKDKETIGCNMTYNDSIWAKAGVQGGQVQKGGHGHTKDLIGKSGQTGYFRPGVCFINEFKPAPKLNTWTTHIFNVTIDKDPTEVKFYMIIPYGITWFDNLVVKLNGSPIKLVFDLNK